MKKDENSITAELMNKLIFPLSKEVFEAWASNFPTVPFELAIIRGEEILLSRREDDDKFWPNLLNLPGTIIRQNEKFMEAYNRLVKSEVGIEGKDLGTPVFRKCFEFLKGSGDNENPRGHEISLLFQVNTDRIFPKGMFFKLSEIPKDIVSHHRIILDYLQKNKI